MFPGPTLYRFSMGFDLGSDTLLDHIQSGDAAFAVQIDSKWTNYRQVFQFSESEYEVEIPEHKLRGIFFLRPFIVAKKEFKLQSDEFNNLFGGMVFPMRRGYVLAWDNPQEFEAVKNLDDLKNINSVLQIVRSKKTNVPVEYKLDGDKIEIYLPEKEFEQYSVVKNHAGHRTTLMCLLALPAVAYAIKAYLDDGEAHSEARWVHVLKRRLEDLSKAGFNKDDDPFRLAQAMLDLPISRAIQAIYTLDEQGSI